MRLFDVADDHVMADQLIEAEHGGWPHLKV
jgi:hypothetical protein